MAKSAEVDRWFETKKHPLENAMQCVRDIVLGADARISETVQYGTVHFGYLGDLASFVHLDEPRVTLMFNRGAKLAGAFPHLQGSGPTARFMRFASIEDVRSQATELRGIAVAWCKLLSTGGEMPVSTPRLPVVKAKAKKSAPKAKAKKKPAPKAKKKPAPKKKVAKKKR